MLLLSSCSQKESTLGEIIKPNRKSTFAIYEVNNEPFLLNINTGEIWSKQCVHKSTRGQCKYAAFLKEDIEGVSRTRSGIHLISKLFAEKEAEDLKEAHTMDSKDPFADLPDSK